MSFEYFSATLLPQFLTKIEGTARERSFFLQLKEIAKSHKSNESEIFVTDGQLAYSARQEICDRFDSILHPEKPKDLQPDQGPLTTEIAALYEVPPKLIEVQITEENERLFISLNFPDDFRTNRFRLCQTLSIIAKNFLHNGNLVESIDLIQFPFELPGNFHLIVSKNEEQGYLKVTIEIFNFLKSFCGCLKNISLSKNNETLSNSTNHKALIHSFLNDLGITDFDENETFVSLGLDSLEAADLEAHISQSINIDLESGFLLKYSTPRELLAFLKSEKRKNVVTDKMDEERFELTPYQEQFLVACQQEPHLQAQFNEGICIKFPKSQYCEQKLKEAMNELAGSHVILRTIFSNFEAVVVPNPELKLLKRSPSDLMKETIDIHSEVPWKVAVSEENENILIAVVFHHIAVDASGISIAIRDLMAAYHGKKLSKHSRRKNESNVSTEDVDFWKNHLLNCSFDRLPLTTKNTQNGRRANTISFILPKAVSQAIAQIRRILNMTTFEIFIAAVRILVYKQFHLNDYVLGVAVSQRNSDEDVDCLVNMLPMRLELNPNGRVCEFFKHFKSLMQEVKEKAVVPYREIVRAIRHLDDPLFEILLVQDKKSTDQNISQIPAYLAKYPQTWYFTKLTDKLEIKIEYNRSIFDSATITDFVYRIQYLIMLLGKANSTKLIKEICLHRPVDKVLENLAKFQNKKDFPRSSVNHIWAQSESPNQRFEFDRESLNRQEILERSRKTSGFLFQQYCRNFGEIPVADRQLVVQVDRGLHLVVLAYAARLLPLSLLPISKDWPIARVLSSLNQLPGSILITDDEQVFRVAQKEKHCVQMLEDITMNRFQGRSLESMHINDIAYVTSTSGTTSMPKAVCTPLIGHSNLAMNYVRRFCLNSRSKLYSVVNFAFDIFFSDLNKAWTTGATFRLSKENIPDEEELSGITNAYIMPAVISTLSEERLKILNNLETLHFGGESIQPSILRNLLGLDISVFQEYGSTEQTVFSTYDRQKKDHINSFGQPYSNLHIRCQDGDGLPSAGNFLAEIHLVGMLARGYLNLPDMSRSRFCRNGTVKEFKTGDLALLPFKQLRGRTDLQKKLHGRRIELPEIQAKVSSFPGILASVADIRDDRLLVFFTASVPTETLKLRGFLGDHLPASFVPNGLIQIPEFPLNSNGKIDLRKLTEPQEKGAWSEVDEKSEVSELERQILSSMAHFLKSNLHVDDDFYLKGGDSLKAILISQDLKSKGIQVTITEILRHKSARNIAKYICRRNLEMKKDDGSIVAAISNRTVIELSSTQKRLLFVRKLFPERDIHTLRLNIRFKGQIHLERLKNSVNKVIKMNSLLRLKILNDYEGEIAENLELSLNSPKWDSLNIEIQVVDAHFIAAPKPELYLAISHMVCDGRSLAIIGEQLVKIYNGLSMDSTKSAPRVEADTDEFEFWSQYLKDFESEAAKESSGLAARQNAQIPFITALRRKAKELEISIFEIISTAFRKLLDEVLDKEDVVFGIISANRNISNYDEVGSFSAVVPVRLNSADENPDALLLSNANEIRRILGKSPNGLERATSGRSGIFDFVLNSHTTSLNEMPPFDGIEVEADLLQNTHVEFLQSWTLAENQDSIELFVEYDKCVFNSLQISEEIKLFLRILRRLVEPVGVFMEFTETRQEIPRKTIAYGFLNQTKKTPYAIVVDELKNKKTYDALNQKIQSLSVALEQSIIRKVGLLPRADDTVMISLAEGEEMLSRQLSILLLGCSYCAVDPATSAERKNEMFMESGAICKADDIEPFPILKRKFRLRSHPNDLAYVMFTSGTTGNPKGVPIQNLGVMNMLSHATRLYCFRPNSRISQFAKSCFDASVSNTFGAVTSGATLCFRDLEAEVNDSLKQLLPLTVVHMTPMVLEYVSQDDRLRNEVELFSCGGESISNSALNRLIDDGVRLVQLYGPTEATCYQTYLCTKRLHSPKCIGKPLWNLHHGICSWTRARKRSIRGQFFCGGIQISRGYLNNRHEDKFFQSDQSIEDQILGRYNRSYLTGDKVGFRNWFYYFEGRIDNQLKVNGIRIEIAEIERFLLLKGIEAVVVPQNHNGKAQLVAFHLTDRIDDMIVFNGIAILLIKVEKFPLTLNGKINRKALSLMNIATKKDFRCETEEELQMASIFSEILQIKIGVDDNFFNAGGHSLLITKLIGQIKHTFRKEIAVSDVFYNPTPRLLLNKLTDLESISHISNEKTDVSDDNFPVTPLENSLLRAFRSKETQKLYTNSLKSKATSMSHEEFRRIAIKILKKYPILRSNFSKRNGKFIRRILDPEICLEPGEIDVFTGPSCRISYDNNEILLQVSHVVTDGRSMAILSKDFRDLQAGNDLQKDYSLEFHNYLAHKFETDGAKSKEFWRNYSTQIDHLFPESYSYRHDSEDHIFTVPKLNSTLSALAKKYAVTPFTVINSLLSAAIASTVNKQTIRLGFPVNLRPTDLMQSIGFGVSSLFLESNPSGKVETDLSNTSIELAKVLQNPFVTYEDLMVNGRKPFQVMLVFDEIRHELEFVANENLSKFEITVFVMNDEIKISFWKDVVDLRIITKISEHFVRILNAWLKGEECLLQSTTRRQLSKPQLQMYFLSQSHPKDFVLPFIVRLPNFETLQQAVDALVNRHSSFRSTFSEENGVPSQEIHSKEKIVIHRLNQHDQNLKSIIDHGRVIDISKQVVEIDFIENQSIAIFWIHHIVCDGWSTRILEEDLQKFLRTGKLNGTDDLGDHQIFDPPASNYINELSQNLPPSFDLDDKINKSECQIAIDQRSNETVFANALLKVSRGFCETFQTKSVNIGFANSNRNRRNSKTVGYFLNHLVISIDPENKVAEISEKIRELLSLNCHITDVVASVREKTGKEHFPFAIYVNFRYDLEEIKENDEFLGILPLRCEFPIELDFDKFSDKYKITVRSKLKADIHKRFCENIRRNFDEIDPLERLHLKAINNIDSEVPDLIRIAENILQRKLSDKCDFFSSGGNSLQAIKFVEQAYEEIKIDIDLQDLYAGMNFEELMKKYRLKSHRSQIVDVKVISGPKLDIPRISASNLLRNALSCHSGNLFISEAEKPKTYSEIENEVHLRAGFLRDNHVKMSGMILRSDDVIPILVDSKSEDLWMDIYAVFMAGAAYLPLSGELKNHQLTSIKKLIRSQYIISNQATGSGMGISIAMKRKVHRNLLTVDRNSLGYLIRTSGTTGEPKIVCIEQKSIVNLALCAVKDFYTSARSVIYQFTKPCFDNSVLENFMTISVGASLLIDNLPFSPRRFLKLLNSHKISHSLLFPALVNCFNSHSFNGLRELPYWITGAEPLPRRLLEKAVEAGISVFQNYGPTETTAYALTRRMKSEDNPQNLGSPISNCEISLNEGEAMIRGLGRMRGYFGRNESSEVLQSDKWYASGDEMEVSGGNFIFRGRKAGQQVKIRGHRVELPEILEAVEDLVQAAYADFYEETLTLYVVCSCNESQVRQRCEEMLPSYMRPDKIRIIERIPLTENCKIDVNALREIGNYRKTTMVKESHRTTFETVLNCWKEVLGDVALTGESRFLLSGGTSLHFLKLRSLLEKSTNLKISLNSLISTSTLGTMTELIDGLANGQEIDIDVPRIIGIEDFKINFVFVPALYGGTLPYSHVINYLKAFDNLEIILLDEITNPSSIDEMADQYMNQLNKVIMNLENTFVIGASFAGTMAYELARRDNKITPILIDSNSNYGLIEPVDFNRHIQDIINTSVNISREEIEQIGRRSWRLLQILKSHKLKRYDGLLHQLSIDGSDLGWRRYCRVKSKKIRGPHHEMLTKKNSSTLALTLASIAQL